MLFSIRPYRKKDRSAVRALAVGTAEAGNKSTFHDLELWADHLTRYYTDVEPQSTFIVEQNNQVVGYLTGCLETTRYLSWLNRYGHLRIFIRLLTHHLFHPDMWKWAWSRVKTIKAGGAHQPAWVKPFPSHFHMNLTGAARGKGMGTRLLKEFEDYARQANSRGIHLSTITSNADAQRFFQKNGFQKASEVVAYRPTEKSFEEVSVTIMTKPLT